MGKKKLEENEVEAAEKPKTDEKEEEDTPIVKTLKEIDDRFCKLECEYEAEHAALRRKYDKLQAPLLEERAKALADASTAEGEDKNSGTPACTGFWLQALQNCEISESIEDHDEDVLNYLKDIKWTEIGEEIHAGGKIEFTFAENPFFTNETLWIQYKNNYDKEKYKPYEDVDTVEWTSNGVDWKPGKNVTVEMTTKKTKGGGAKKAKQKAKAKEEPRPSFFRFFFCNLKKGDALPDALKCYVGDEDEDVDDEAVVGILEQLEMSAGQLQEVVIKYAIRLYTGEIQQDDDDDDMEGEDSESEMEPDEEEDDEEDDAPKGKGKGKGKGKSNKKAVKGSDAESGKGAGKEKGKNQEECKQQ